MDWEIRASPEEGNRVFRVRLHSGASRDITPTALTQLNKPVMNWDIDQIVRAIG